MAVPAGKTPISFLQEICTKRGITPQYDLVANEGAIHEPMFLMSVVVGDITATGKGTSKKKAKHAAAQSALNTILGVMPVDNNVKTEENEASGNKEEEGLGNPIGELQEFTQKKLIKPPIYDYNCEQGPPHSKEFKCKVKIGKFEQIGTGRSKKAAKRAAASQLLEEIRKLMLDSNENAKIEHSDEEEDLQLSFEPQSAYTALKEGKRNIAVTTPQKAKEIQKFYQKIMKNGGSRMKELHKNTLNIPNTNYCQMLQEIAEVQRFEVSYFDIKELNNSNQHQCLVQLSSLPVAVCQGTGPTPDDAHANAAHNALQYLRFMTAS
ncbi:hypothetical protein LOTGIDRAFT_199429 [Lottia gigantea]|uniref:DRBM domain-containing protein n=1 Tax=Lottia gigantea TaxID=225164 RepID=V4BB11_LOTGI|nr:hypothetical protein LOTGIDRAFT_199429 [Lottia gigantea]ESP03182.1 hypothetical protein LOTGIDRAFT_199429 [Lottia gigantea]